MNDHNRGAAPGQRQPDRNQGLIDFIGTILAITDQTPRTAGTRRRIEATRLPGAPFLKADYALMAHELPLIGRLVANYTLRILAAFKPHQWSCREQRNLVTAALKAKSAMDQLRIAAEAMCRRQYPTAPWLVGFEEFSEEKDPFEYLPELIRIQKANTAGQGAEHDETK